MPCRCDSQQIETSKGVSIPNILVLFSAFLLLSGVRNCGNSNSMDGARDFHFITMQISHLKYQDSSVVCLHPLRFLLYKYHFSHCYINLLECLLLNAVTTSKPISLILTFVIKIPQSLSENVVSKDVTSSLIHLIGFLASSTPLRSNHISVMDTCVERIGNISFLILRNIDYNRYKRKVYFPF